MMYPITRTGRGTGGDGDGSMDPMDAWMHPSMSMPCMSMPHALHALPCPA